jgi:hypothetical protein
LQKKYFRKKDIKKYTLYVILRHFRSIFLMHFLKNDFFCNLNRSVCASPPVGGSGYAKRQSGLRPFVWFCSAAFFLIGRKKMSYTAGTLGDIYTGIEN